MKTEEFINVVNQYHLWNPFKPTQVFEEPSKLKIEFGTFNGYNFYEFSAPKDYTCQFYIELDAELKNSDKIKFNSGNFMTDSHIVGICGYTTIITTSDFDLLSHIVWIASLWIKDDGTGLRYNMCSLDELAKETYSQSEAIEEYNYWVESGKINNNILSIVDSFSKEILKAKYLEAHDVGDDINISDVNVPVNSAQHSPAHIQKPVIKLYNGDKVEETYNLEPYVLFFNISTGNFQYMDNEFNIQTING